MRMLRKDAFENVFGVGEFIMFDNGHSNDNKAKMGRGGPHVIKEVQ